MKRRSTGVLALTTLVLGAFLPTLSAGAVRAVSLGGSGFDLVTDLALDRQGNVYLTGSFSGALSLAGCNKQLTSVGGSDFFVAKLDGNGQCLWVDQLTNSAKGDNLGGASVAVDPSSGDVVVASSESGDALYLRRYDQAGTSLWSPPKKIGSGIKPYRDLVIKANGNILLAATHFWDAPRKEFLPVTLDGVIASTLTLYPWSRDPHDHDQQSSAGRMALEFRPDGTLEWAMPIGLNVDTLAEDNAGVTWVGGGYYGDLPALHPDTFEEFLPNSKEWDGFAATIVAGPKVKSKIAFGGDGWNVIEDMAIAADGSKYFIGKFDGEVTVGNGHQIVRGQDLFLAKFDSSLNFLWLRQFLDDNGRAWWGRGGAPLDVLAHDPVSGDVAFSGTLLGSYDLGCGVYGIPQNARRDQETRFVARYTSSGARVGAFALPNTSMEDMMFDGSGEIVLTGNFFGTINIPDGGQLTSKGRTDMYVLRIPLSACIPLPSCTDGTANGQCSATKPMFCGNSTLVPAAQFCGCPPGTVPQPNGTCAPPPGCDPPNPPPDKTPRIAYWWGKVNQHLDATCGWQTDPDRSSGANIAPLVYCKKWYPGTVSVQDYKMETINDWRDANNNSYVGTVMTKECKQQ